MFTRRTLATNGNAHGPAAGRWLLGVLLVLGFALTAAVVLPLILVYPPRSMVHLLKTVGDAAIPIVVFLLAWVTMRAIGRRPHVAVPLSLACVSFYIAAVINLLKGVSVLPDSLGQSGLALLILGGAVSLMVGLIRWAQETTWLEQQRLRGQERVAALERFVADAIGATDRQRVVGSLAQAVSAALQADRSWCLLLDPERQEFREVGQAPTPLTLKAASPFVRWLGEQRHCVTMPDVEALRSGGTSSSEEELALKAKGAQLLVPITAGDRMIGILVLGPKRSGERYTPDDHHLLVTVGLQAGFILEHARLDARDRERAAELEELDRRKKEFLAMVAHQLKSPLTSIKAALGLLQEELAAPAEAVSFRLMDSATRGVEELEKLVMDLLDFARVWSARTELALEVVHVGELVQAAAVVVAPLLQAKEQQILVEVVPGGVQVEADRKRLAQVLLNLLNNAICYSPAGKTITVAARYRDGQAVVSVGDACGGIPPEEQRWLFQAYAQPRKESPASVAGGSGLGLAIAKGLVELHGGEIWVESIPGKGCIFSFSLPLERGQAVG